MKILYCLAGTFNSGGMERIVTAKANWLEKNGYEVIIVTTEQNGRPNYFPLNKNIKRIDLDLMYSSNISSNPLNKYHIREHLLKYHKRELQNIVDIHKPDIIISTFGNEIGIVPNLKTEAKKIAEIHFSRWYRLQYNRKGIWKWIDQYLTWKDKRVLSKYDKFVTLTEEDKKNWNSKKNLVVIPNFIEPASLKPANLSNQSMIAVGRLSYQKGYERMIEAWKTVVKKYPEWKLNIFGGGELEQALKDLIKSNNLDYNIVIHAPTKDIEKEYQKNSALILSSRYEGLPMVLLEAMNIGLPLISFSCQCGPKDIIKNGVNGILVPEGDIPELANAIIKIIENPKLRQNIGKNSLSESAKYNIENIMAKWVKLFKSL